MAYEMDAAARTRLEEFLGQTGTLLRDVRKRESFAIYAYGLLGDGERKSVEPMAARACGAPEHMEGMHAKLLHFVSDSKWDDGAIRRFGARHAISAMEKHHPVKAWIVDDTGMLKQGEHSAGVQRQYTGSAGKIANCQIGVSLAAATETAHIPLDFELYLPRSWTDAPARRKEVRIPDDVTFKTKTELALDMIERAARAEIPGDIVLADCAYGDSCDFRNAVRLIGFDFAVGIEAKTRVLCLDANDEPEGPSCTALELGKSLTSIQFRRITWREGSKRSLASRFAFRRVKTMHNDGVALADREPLWLIMEWPEGEAAPTKFALTTLPRRMSKKQIIRLMKMRWRTERMYEDLKGELGLDHFEGRSFPGWHHHVSVALWCYAFVIAEQARAFPPSAGGERTPDSLPCAA
jgi:SRSO17 transposase